MKNEFEIGFCPEKIHQLNIKIKCLGQWTVIKKSVN